MVAKVYIFLFIYSALTIITFSQVADVNYTGDKKVEMVKGNESNYEQLSSDCHTMRKLQGSGQILKGLVRGYKVYRRAENVYETVTFTLTQLRDYLDSQCQYPSYCCSNTVNLECQQCCTHSGMLPEIIHDYLDNQCIDTYYCCLNNNVNLACLQCCTNNVTMIMESAATSSKMKVLNMVLISLIAPFVF